MKNLFIIIFVFFVKSLCAQFTYVPDDNFEQALINLGVDSVIDDYVYTASIDTVTVLYVNNKNISDLSGIEDFISLRELYCYTNQITKLCNPSQTNLEALGWCVCLCTSTSAVSYDRW